MSDRSDESSVERVHENGSDGLRGVAAGEGATPGTAWVVSPGGQAEPASPTLPTGPTWAGATTTEERVWSPPSEKAPSSRVGQPQHSGPDHPNGAPAGGRGRGWLPVAIVAALIGAAVGAGVTALADHNGSSNPLTTIKEGNAAPGAAIANGASIPKLVDELLPAVVSIDVKTSVEEDEGTGMIISPDGLVVTNYHVIALADQGGGTLTVTESGSTSAVKATLVGTDQTDDVALLRITGATDLKTITFGNSDKAVVGDAVVAIGNALGLSQGSPTVTQGIVSAIGRTVTAGASATNTETLSGLIQTDAAINPGNSGGPLVDTAGEVIGMNTAVAGTTSDGTSAQNIGFAIPSAQIESLLPTLEKGGTKATTPGYLGVFVTTLTPQLRSEYGLTPPSGALVTDVVPGGPAAQAGLTQGDVIVRIGSKTVSSQADLQSATQGDVAGQTVRVTYYRGSTKQSAPVMLVSQSAIQNLESQGISGLGFGSNLGGGGVSIGP